MSTAPDPPPPPAGGPVASRRLPLALAAGGGVLLIVVAAVALLRKPDDAVTVDPDVATVSGGGITGTRIPAYDKKEPLVLDEVESPSTWVDVTSPKAMRSVLTENAWLKQVTSSPLGQGFLGSWGAFFGSANDDLGLEALGKGLLGDVVAEHLFTQPARLMWFQGWSGVPALVVPKPEKALASTVSALTTTLQRGGYLVDQCPGEAPVTDEAQKLAIVRWIAADHTLYVAVARDRFVVAREAHTVVNALCAPLPTIDVVAGTDLVVGLVPEKLGRDGQALSAILGVGPELRFGFAVDGTRLKPVGLTGALAHPERLAETAIAKDTWKLVPDDVPVVVGANLLLPETLSTESLAAFWAKDAAKVPVKAREVLVLWQPHGDDRPTEIAVVWSDVGDRAALETILSGPNRMTISEACGRLVASSTPALTSRVQAACGGASPSILFAAPAVVAGLQQPWSAGVIVDTGRLLQQLLVEGYVGAEKQEGRKATPTPEIEAARQQLGELPRIGIVGVKSKAALTGQGFSS